MKVVILPGKDDLLFIRKSGPKYYMKMTKEEIQKFINKLNSKIKRK